MRDLATDTQVLADLRARVAGLEGMLASRTSGRWLYVDNQAARPTEGLYAGLVVCERDKLRLVTWDGDSWQRCGHLAPTGRTYFGVANSTTPVTIGTVVTPTWSTEDDPDGAIASGTFTVPAECGGYWNLYARMVFATTVATTNSILRFLINGGAHDFAGNLQPSGVVSASFDYRLIPGDTVTAQIYTGPTAGTLASGSLFRGELLHI